MSEHNICSLQVLLNGDELVHPRVRLLRSAADESTAEAIHAP